MQTHKLKEIMRPLVDALQPQEQLRQLKATQFAVNQDGGINPGALTNVLPWLTAVWFLSGSPTAGNGQGPLIEMPQNVRIKRIRVLLKTPHATQNLIARVMDDGTEVDRVTVQKTTTSGVSTMDFPVASGSLLRLDIVQAGGTDVTVCVHYVLDTGVL